MVATTSKLMVVGQLTRDVVQPGRAFLTGVCELGEQTGQVLEIAFAPCREAVVEYAALPLQSAGDVAAAGWGEANGVGASVGGIDIHADESCSVERVDQPAHGAAVHGHPLRDVARSARAEGQEPSGDVERGGWQIGMEPARRLRDDGAGGGEETGQLRADLIDQHRLLSRPALDIR